MLSHLNFLKKIGRFEYTQGSSYKYWQIKYISDDYYEVTWGRIGYSSSGTMHLNYKKAVSKIEEKIKKGYSKVASLELDSFHQKVLLEYGVDKPQEKDTAKKFKI